MALVHESFILPAVTPTLIATIPPGNQMISVLITNVNAASVYIGDASVTTTGGVDRGIKIPTDSTKEIWLHAEDKLYAASAAGTGSSYDVAVLYSKIIG
jgi:hypothetical protein